MIGKDNEYNTNSLLDVLATPANVGGSKGVSILDFFAGVDTGLLLFSEFVKSEGILFALRFPLSWNDVVGEAEREAFPLK